MLSRLPISTLFPYTTLFRSYALSFLFPDTDPSRVRWERPNSCRPVSATRCPSIRPYDRGRVAALHRHPAELSNPQGRSEEHTSELQSLRHLVCRLLLEKKKL